MSDIADEKAREWWLKYRDSVFGLTEAYAAGYREGLNAPRTGVEAMMQAQEKEFREMVKNYDFQNDPEWNAIQSALENYRRKRFGK